MEKRNVELTLEKAREWYKKGGELREVALQAFNEAELIEWQYPRSVEECLKNYRNFLGDKGYYVNQIGGISDAYPCVTDGFDANVDKNILPTQELAAAMLALTQLVTLRKAWVGVWKPDWTDCKSKWCIEFFNGKFEVEEYETTGQFFSFPTEKMASEFLNTFHHVLFEQVKPLFA